MLAGADRESIVISPRPPMQMSSAEDYISCTGCCRYWPKDGVKLCHRAVHAVMLHCCSCFWIRPASFTVYTCNIRSCSWNPIAYSLHSINGGCNQQTALSEVSSQFSDSLITRFHWAYGAVYSTCMATCWCTECKRPQRHDIRTVWPLMVWMRGCQGSFKTPPRVQSASTVAGPETLICLSFTSDRAGSKRMVNALWYLLKPVTSLVGSTNLQDKEREHCFPVPQVTLYSIYVVMYIHQTLSIHHSAYISLYILLTAKSRVTCRQSHMLSPRCKVWLQEYKLQSSICLQSSANTSGVKLPVTKYWPSAKSWARISYANDNSSYCTDLWCTLFSICI